MIAPVTTVFDIVCHIIKYVFCLLSRTNTIAVSKGKGLKHMTKPGHHGPDLSFRTEKTSLHDKYSSTKSLGGDKKRTGSNESKREQNGLSLPELRKADGKSIK